MKHLHKTLFILRIMKKWFMGYIIKVTQGINSDYELSLSLDGIRNRVGNECSFFFFICVSVYYKAKFLIGHFLWLFHLFLPSIIQKIWRNIHSCLKVLCSMSEMCERDCYPRRAYSQSIWADNRHWYPQKNEKTTMKQTGVSAACDRGPGIWRRKLLVGQSPQETFHKGHCP